MMESTNFRIGMSASLVRTTQAALTEICQEPIDAHHRQSRIDRRYGRRCPF